MVTNRIIVNYTQIEDKKDDKCKIGYCPKVLVTCTFGQLYENVTVTFSTRT